MEQSGWPTDPDHPVIKRIVDEAVAARGGWQLGSPDNTFDALAAFIAAVDWQQPPLLALAALHLTLVILALTLRRHYMLQFTLIALCWAAVLCSERINTYCRQHSASIGMPSSYFDANGVFVSAVWSAPLAVVAFVTLLCLLYDASSMLIVVKRKQLKLQRQQNQRRQQQQGEGDGQSEGTVVNGAHTVSAAHRPIPVPSGRRRHVNGST